jgi:peptidoglycan hydrolase CwlO-like protein
MNDDLIAVMNADADRINANLNQELMDRYPFKAIQDAQETQREGWMAEIKPMSSLDYQQSITELNQRLIDRQESFQAQLVRIEETWREKLVESKAEIDRLKKEIERYSGNCKAMDGIIGELQAELAKALTSQRQ